MAPTAATGAVSGESAISTFTRAETAGAETETVGDAAEADGSGVVVVVDVEDNGVVVAAIVLD